jgi:membrane protein
MDLSRHAMTLSSKHSGVTVRPIPRADVREDAKLQLRDYVGILRRAAGSARKDNITNVAAALAYYAFLVIPSALLVAVGVFSLVASADTVSTLVDKLGTIMPTQATSLIEQSLRQVTRRQSTGLSLVVIGGVLAVWSLGGAMQNVMWGLNTAYGREETRGFVRRRLTAWAMAFFVLVAFLLSFGVLVLGPALSTWIGNALDAKSAVTIVWWAAEWPLLVLGLLVAFAGVLYLGPDSPARRWRFLSFGAVVSVVLWLAASGAFAYFVSRFGSYNKTWGSLAAVVILLTWFWLSALALLFGAEIDAEGERTASERS